MKFRHPDAVIIGSGADGGLFVTSTGYNPTLTIQTLACRQAYRILA